MGNFPVPDFKYDGLLISSLVPCERRSEFKKWVRFYLHFCEKYQHNPADVKSLPLFIEKLSSKNQTTEQQAFDESSGSSLFRLRHSESATQKNLVAVHNLAD